jgi:hypothetical protein
VTSDAAGLAPANAQGPDDPRLPAALPPGYHALLRAAFDVHVHGYPDILPALPLRGDDWETVRLAHAYGISGWVLKSHLWLTTDRARLLHEQAAGLGFTVCGSITLNPVLGGLSATVVELAAAHGARVVFLPTWARRQMSPETATSPGCWRPLSRLSRSTRRRTRSRC